MLPMNVVFVKGLDCGSHPNDTHSMCLCATPWTPTTWCKTLLSAGRIWFYNTFVIAENFSLHGQYSHGSDS
jgi:hypothetical protein